MANKKINYIFKMKLEEKEDIYIYSVVPAENSLRYKYYILSNNHKKMPIINTLPNGIEFIKKYNKRLTRIKPSTNNKDYILFTNLKEQAEENYLLQEPVKEKQTSKNKTLSLRKNRFR